MSIELRLANAQDIPRVQRFYADRQYAGGIRPEDTVILAEQDGELVGLVRLAPEESVVVLRGMQVHPRLQREGVGTRLLGNVAEVLQEKICFCIPYAHLVDFYGRIGFVVIDPASAPKFLKVRLEGYQNRRDGNKYVLMRRPGSR